MSRALNGSPPTKRRRNPPLERRIPPELWERHRPQIERLYLGADDCQDLPLAELRPHFREIYNFDPTEKQWKTQLSKWGMKKNLSTGSAALVLWAYKDAETKGIERQVYFNKRKISREKITLYIKKQINEQGIKNEEELLLCLPEPCDRPRSVTWHDGDAAHQAPVQLSDDVVDNGRHTKISRSQPGYQPPMVEPPSQYPSQFQYTEQFQQPAWWQQDNAFDEPMSSSTRYGFAVNQVPGEDLMSIDRVPAIPFPSDPDMFASSSAFDELYRPETYVPAEVEAGDPLVTFGAYMSSTPASFRFGPPYNTSSRAQQLKRFVSAMLHEKDQQHNGTPASRVVKHSCEAAIYSGQQRDGSVKVLPEFSEELNQALRDATQAYHDTLDHQHDESLNVLNFDRIMLEAYGHGDLARTLLVRFRQVVDAPSSQGGSLVAGTIDFWIATTLDWDDETAQAWLPRVQEIHRCALETYARDSQLVITAEYNMAWDLLETDIPENYEKALIILNEGKRFCEKASGLCHLQTTSWLTTLARAHLYTKNETSAEAILEESVLPRVKKMYSGEHPLYWVTKCRQALYLLRIADKNTQPNRRNECWTSGTNSLREVLVWRARVLGINNPQTSKVLGWLKGYLVKQDKQTEADNLREWCIQQITPLE